MPELESAGTGRRDTDEIEVTDAMIAAGADVVWRAFGDVIPYGSETGEATAAAVFRAMARHRP